MTRMHARTRAARADDLTALVGLVELAGVTQVPGTNRQLQHGAAAALSDRMCEILSDPTRHVLVALDDESDEPIGVAVLVEDRINEFVAEHAVRLAVLVVAPGHRRRGTGRSLLAAAVQLAEQRGLDHVVVPAVSRSRDANRYLARLGFVPMISSRLASTTVLRRSLGLVEAPERLAVRRRALVSRAAGRPLRRGA